MRITAGIIMMIIGFMPLGILGHMNMLLSRVSTIVPIDPDEITSWMIVPTLLLMGIIWGSAIGVIKGKKYAWALVGAICSVFISFLSITFGGLFGFTLFILAILALIFLIKRRGQFQA